MSANFSDIVSIPYNANLLIRNKFGLRKEDKLKVTFIPGPGDLIGTYQYWLSGQNDPRIPTIAYSLMFYELMKQLDVECQVISLNKIPDENIAHESASFRFEYVDVKPSRGRWSYFINQYAFSKILASKVRRFDPHIVITSTHNPTFSWIALSKRRKLILTAHNTFWPQGHEKKGGLNYFRKALLRFHASSLDGAICTSSECARQINEVTCGRICGEVECPQIVKTYDIEERDAVQRLLYLGRIEESKGIFQLVDVFEQLAEIYPNLSLAIAGEGTAQDRLRQTICKSHYSDRINFFGRIDSENVHSAIAGSDLVVCPTMTSFSEGLAVVGFEAAAHGIPSVLSSVVPAAELLGDSCSIYEADNAEALKEKIADLINDPLLYQKRCTATLEVRKLIYNRELSWGSGLCRELLSIE